MWYLAGPARVRAWSVFEGLGFEPTFGLKIDAESFEDEVIKGASRLLHGTQFVIAELSVAERFRRGYAFSDFAERIDAAGFYLWDILNAVRIGVPLLANAASTNLLPPS